MLELTCRDELGNPVCGYVEFVRPDGRWDLVQTDEKGVAKGDGPYRSATVKPMDGHWNVWIGPLDHSEQAEVVCPTLEREQALSWWRRLLCPEGCLAGKGSGVRIGVIDIPFQPDESLKHIQCFDIEGIQLNCAGLPLYSHGYRVCKTISERGSTPHRQGMACDAQLFFIDVSDDFSNSEWDFDKIGPAIELLVEDFNVDIINISGGSFAASEEHWEEISEFLQEYIGNANSEGVVVFAAVGNNAKAGIALPAGMNCVLGVGAVGLCGVAPQGTLMAAYEQIACDVEGSMGKLPSGGRIFHYLDTGYGAGLDLVGPGIGIVMEMDGGVLAEYEGTSYACPVVVAAIAGCLGESRSRRPEHRHERYTFSTELIRSTCVDLGMEKARQGWGLPILK